MKKRQIIILLPLFFQLPAMGQNYLPAPVSLVNVFVGTDQHGHTFPGAMVPFGMVQLSPDTRVTTWDGCSGYHYSDSSILGFSHIHYSGVGSGGGADILLMPTTGKVQLEPGDPSDTKSGYRAAFSHKTEKASPGYYSVLLEGGIGVELTSTKRVGFHQYNFEQADTGNILIDLVHGIDAKVDSLYIQKVSGTRITGFRHCHGALDGNRSIYFVADFSRPFDSYGFYKDDALLENVAEAAGKNIKAHFKFPTRQNRQVLVKLAISRVDVEGAIKNLEMELPGWDFNKVKQEAEKAWKKELSRIELKGGTKEQQRTFYTALYHAYIHPNTGMDADKRYRGTDRKIRTADGFDNYTTFSLWDTFRALHPLYTLLSPTMVNQFIRNFIERYQHFGSLPIMEFGGTEGFAMIGYHSLPVIADAWAKGIRNYEVGLVYEAMKQLSEGYRTGKSYYRQMGFIPFDLETESVSKTLEYAYDDWCVSVLADSLNKKDYEFYSQKGQLYRNLYNPKTGFMQARNSAGEWKTPFNPLEMSNEYTEANAYQYSLFAPHDINGLINLMGGDKKFENWLDSCFGIDGLLGSEAVQDASGNIGQYAHGNEPSHHMAYLYNFVGKPWKTQQRVYQILSTLYNDQPEGLCGNDDAGQTSAWYVLSAMGFYQVTPGLNYYVIGAPLFNQVTLHLENGKDFIISREKPGIRNVYIQSASLNGKNYNKSFIGHADIMRGGQLSFAMGDAPQPKWGNKPADRPKTPFFKATATPFIEAGTRDFEKTAPVTISCPDKNAAIFYTTDGSEPDQNSKRYNGPFSLSNSAMLKAKSFAKGLIPSYTVSANFKRLSLQAASIVEKPGSMLHYKYYEDYFTNIESMKKAKMAGDGFISLFNISAINDEREFGYLFSGYILAPQSGVYTFFLNSNDGADLLVNGEQLIDNDGNHRTQEKWAKVALEKGFHAIEVHYFQSGGQKALKLSWAKPGSQKEEILATALFH